MAANLILLSFCNENDGKGFDSKPNFKYKWGYVQNYCLFAFCIFTFTEKLEALAKGKRSLPTGARSSEVTSLGWQQIRLWTTHMRGSRFWFSISTDLPLVNHLLAICWSWLFKMQAFGAGAVILRSICCGGVLASAEGYKC